MPRRFTRASNERIHVGTAAALSGLNFLFGTWAAVVYRVSTVVAFETIFTLNASANTGMQVGFDGTTSGQLFWFGSDGAAGGSVSRAINTSISQWLLVGGSKATGQVTPVLHHLVLGTNVWTHTNGSATIGNCAANTSMTIGCGADSATEPIDAEIQQIGLWPGWAMSNSEFENLARLPALDWFRYGASFFERFEGHAEVGDMMTTLGRFPTKQTARTGTTRGAQRLSPGSGDLARRQRR